MRTILVSGGLALGLSLCASLPAAAQTPIKNPAALVFACPDHAGDDQHEIDIVRVSDGVVVATVLGGDPPANAAGDVVIPLNVQPIAFGLYRFVARAVAGTVKSDNSLPSEVWERAPGRPTNVRPQP